MNNPDTTRTHAPHDDTVMEVGTRYTLEDANAYAGTAGMVWFDRGVHEGFRRVLASSRTMTRSMLIQWLEHEVGKSA